jgi:hypothetical protein
MTTAVGVLLTFSTIMPMRKPLGVLPSTGDWG